MSGTYATSPRARTTSAGRGTCTALGQLQAREDWDRTAWGKNTAERRAGWSSLQGLYGDSVRCWPRTVPVCLVVPGGGWAEGAVRKGGAFQVFGRAVDVASLNSTWEVERMPPADRGTLGHNQLAVRETSRLDLLSQRLRPRGLSGLVARSCMRL